MVGGVAYSPTGTLTLPTVGSWEQMVATRSWAQVDAWYAANTGHEALGYAYEDLTVGSLESSYDGQVIERVRGPRIRIKHSNVTVRGCRVEGGGVYGYDTSPAYNSPHTGTVIEYVTFDGGTPAVDKAAVLADSTGGLGSVTFRNCHLRGWSSGFLVKHGANVEYCWTEGFYPGSVSGAHVSSFNTTGTDVRFWRNYGTEGASPIMSVYFDKSVCARITITENLLNGSSGNNNASYLLAGKAGAYEAGATDIVMGGNWFGDRYQFGVFAGFGGVPWGTNGNVRTTDYDFATGQEV